MKSAAYRREELLALRASAGESSISLDKFNEEDSVKEHVLKGVSQVPSNASLRSKPENVRPSPGITSQYGEASFGQAPFPYQAKYIAEIATRGVPKISPTPSIKRGKAEKLLKEHGSPPGVRVTAGGRIVPDTLSPLSSPKHQISSTVDHALQKPATDMPITVPNGFIAYDAAGVLCQSVDGRVLPLKSINGMPQLFIAAPNYPNNFMIPQYQSTMQPETHVGYPLVRQNGVNCINQGSRRERSFDASWPATGVNLARQISAFEEQHMKLENERKDLDRSEVLQRNVMTAQVHQQIIARRRDLVLRIDETRKAVMGLKKLLLPTEPTSSFYKDPRDGHEGPRMYTFDAVPCPAYMSGTSADLYRSYAAPYYPQMTMSFPAIHGGHLGGTRNLYNRDRSWTAFDSANSAVPWEFPGMPPHPNTAAFRVIENMNGTFADAVASKLRHSVSYGSAPPAQIRGVSDCSGALRSQQGSRPQPHSPDTTGPSDESNLVIAKSGLNPASPSYEPKNAQLSPAAYHVLPQFLTQSPAASPAPSTSKADADDLMRQLRDEPEYKQREHGSSSSVCTNDFFPKSGDTNFEPNAAKNRGEVEYAGPSPRLALFSVSAPPTTPQRGPMETIWTPTGDDQLGSLLTGSEKKRLRAKAVSMQEFTHKDAVLSPTSRKSLSSSQGLVSESQHHSLESEITLRQPSSSSMEPTGPASAAAPAEAQHGSRGVDFSALSGKSTNQEPNVAEYVHGERGFVDLSKKSNAFQQGYHAGLSRSSVSNDRCGDFIDGYCTGLRISLLGSPPASEATSDLSGLRPATDHPNSTSTDRVEDHKQSLKPSPANLRLSDCRFAESSLAACKFAPAKSVRLNEGPSQTLHATAPEYIPSRAASIMFRESVSTTGKLASNFSRLKQVKATTVSVTPLGQLSGNSAPHVQLSTAGNQYVRYYASQKASAEQQTMNSTHLVSYPKGIARGALMQYDGSKDGPTTESSKAKSLPSTPPRKSSSSPKKLTLSPRIFCPSPTISCYSKGKGKARQADFHAIADDERRNVEEDDPEKMTSDQKYVWRQKWKGRFGKIKREQEAEIAKYKEENPLLAKRYSGVHS